MSLIEMRVLSLCTVCAYIIIPKNVSLCTIYLEHIFFRSGCSKNSNKVSCIMILRTTKFLRLHLERPRKYPVPPIYISTIFWEWESKLKIYFTFIFSGRPGKTSVSMQHAEQERCAGCLSLHFCRGLAPK